MIPNYKSRIEQAAARWPDEWRVAHSGHPDSEKFIRLCASWLHYEIDPLCGLNGKRGNSHDLSQDVIAYRGEGSAVDVVTGGPMEIIDVIAMAGTPKAAPAWLVAPGGPGDRGTWLKPARIHDGIAPVPVPPPAPPPHECPALPEPELDYRAFLDLLMQLSDVHPSREGVAEVVGHWAWGMLREGKSVESVIEDYHARKG